MLKTREGTQPARIIAARIQALDPGINEDPRFVTTIEDLADILPLKYTTREEWSC